jgi:Ni,Fe-hydrogenase maturation factor
MNNYCEIEVNSKKYGVLFGVRLYEVIAEESKNNKAFKISENGTSSMDGICTVWAAIKNNCDLEGSECDLTLKDIVQLADNDTKQYTKALDCLAKSKILGKPIKEMANEVKKKTKKSIFGKLFRKTV